MTRETRPKLPDRQKVHRWATLWTRGVAAVAATIFLGIVSILLGLNSWAGSAPLVTLVRQHPIASLAAGGLLVAISVVALLIASGPAPDQGQLQDASKQGSSWHTPRLMIAGGISAMSSACLVMLVLVVQ